MIVLKHLARDYDYNPFHLRKILRKQFGYAKGHRWRWDPSVKVQAKELQRIRNFLGKRNGTRTTVHK